MHCVFFRESQAFSNQKSRSVYPIYPKVVVKIIKLISIQLMIAIHSWVKTRFIASLQDSLFVELAKKMSSKGRKTEIGWNILNSPRPDRS